MVAQQYKIRFGSRFLLLCVTLACLGMWWFDYLPWKFHREQLTYGQALIHSRDRIHISQCFDKPALDRLITVLGNSGLTHWANVRWIWRPDPKTVVSYGSDDALIVWNYEDGSIRMGFFDATCAAYAAGAQRISWIDADNALYEISLLEPDLEPRRLSFRFEPTGMPRLISSDDGRYLVYSGSGSPIMIWDRESTDLAGPVAIQPGQSEYAIVCTPDSAGLIVAGRSVLVEYDLASGEKKNTIELRGNDRGKPRISACAFSIDGETLAVGDASGQIFEIDWSTRSLRGELISNRNTVYALSMGNDTLMAAGQGVQRYHWFGDPRQTFIHPVTPDRITCLSPGMTGLAALAGGRIIELRDGPSRMKGMRSDAICFAFSPDGKLIAVAGRDGQIVIRDTHRWQLFRSWKAHEGLIERLIWTAGPESTLFSTGDDLLVAWNFETAEELASTHLWTSMSETVAVHPTQNQLVAAGGGNESLVFYERSKFERLDALTVAHLRGRGDVLFSQDGSSLIAGGNQNTLNVWNIAEKKLPLRWEAKLLMTCGWPCPQTASLPTRARAATFWPSISRRRKRFGRPGTARRFRTSAAIPASRRSQPSAPTDRLPFTTQTRALLFSGSESDRPLAS